MPLFFHKNNIFLTELIAILYLLGCEKMKIKKKISIYCLLGLSILSLSSCFKSTITIEKVELEGNVKDSLVNERPIQSIGNNNILAVPLNLYNDYNSDMLDKLDKALFGTSEETGYYSLSNYIKESSYQKLNLDIKRTEPLSVDSNSFDNQNVIDSLIDYLNQIEDIKKFDNDNDNYIDSVFVIYTSDLSTTYTFKQRFENNKTIYLDKSINDTLKVGNISFVDYATIEKKYYSYYDTKDLLIDSHELIHQFGHVLGLDDSEDFEPSIGEKGGEYHTTMMSGMSGDFSAFDKMLLKWTDVYIAKGNQTASTTLKPFVTEGKVVLISNHEVTSLYDEYLVLELYSNQKLNKDNCIKPSNPKKNIFYSIRAMHVNAQLKTNSTGRVIKNDTEYNKTGFVADNSVYNYQRTRFILFKEYSGEDEMTNLNLYNGYSSFLLAFYRYNSSKTITFSLVKVEDDTATLSITL